MSSIAIDSARSIFGGTTEAETLLNMARDRGLYRIYKYANDFGDKTTHTDYKQISYAGDPQETALLTSPHVHNTVLIYDDGKIVNLE